MAYPTDFEESNHVLDKPRDMTYEECDPLCVFIGNMKEGNPIVVSCWKITKEELALINKTGKIWLHVYGDTMPPVIVSCHKPIFHEENQERTGPGPNPE